MTLSQLLAWLAGSEFQSTDTVFIKTSDGVAHALVGVSRTGDTQNTLPPGPDTPPFITLQLG
jgi:hypothetical protein